MRFGPAHVPREHLGMRNSARIDAPSPSLAPLEPYYTVAEIAAHFKTGRQQVHRWIRAGALEVERIGKLVRVSPDALADFERRHRVPVRR